MRLSVRQSSLIARLFDGIKHGLNGMPRSKLLNSFQATTFDQGNHFNITLKNLSTVDPQWNILY